ncbi:MAG: A/G-specific adenine glycosylase [Spirochaetes bacterium]|nr:A/G-specific adenine glycosylase [Spirochaetota bacterium]
MIVDTSAFQRIVLAYFNKHGRNLPWRNTDDEYRIFVSEIMLQQTQVPRVVEKYVPFVSRFKNFNELRAAAQVDILALWQGLGYNRRCIYLKESAAKICDEYSGRLPESEMPLRSLPGVGTATARSLLAFCFNRPVVFLETNIRQVFIHHFFSDRQTVSDRDLYPLVERTLYHENPREWYYALMDYGAMLKKRIGNVTKKSSGYRPAGPFEGSVRQLRGSVLKLLIAHRTLTPEEFLNLTGSSRERMREVLLHLEHEGFLQKKGFEYSLRQ